MSSLLGRAAGFQQGRSDGYRLGFCDSFINGLPTGSSHIREIHILYVTAGIGVPYPALDQAVIAGFEGLVRELSIVTPSDDIVAIADKVKPDLILVLNGVVLHADRVSQLRQRGYKTAVWFTDDPYYTDWTLAIAPRYDYVFTLELNCLPFYRDLGCKNVYYLPFAVNPKAFCPKYIPNSYHTDICFIGTAFWNRVELIDRLTPFLRNKRVIIAGWWWDRLQNYSELSSKIKLGDWLSPEDTASYYNGAKIVINLHRSVNDDSINANSRQIPALSVNPRTFEISGCATAQLSDFRQELDHLYVTGTEIDTYSSDQELIEKIDFYLRHDEEREQLALRGFMRTRRDHTYHHRLSKLLSIIFP